MVDCEEALLVERLRARDEDAFRQLVTRYQAALTRLADSYVLSHALAEEVVQETWLAVIQGIDRFEGRSSVKTWIFRILTNRARTRGMRERRTVPFASFDAGAGDPALASEWSPGDKYRWVWQSTEPPEPWADEPCKCLTDGETRSVLEETVRTLPTQQRQVITLRDIEGWTPEEVCAVLDLSEGNQRVLLHRARCRVRAALERHFCKE